MRTFTSAALLAAALFGFNAFAGSGELDYPPAGAQGGSLTRSQVQHELAIARRGATGVRRSAGTRGPAGRRRRHPCAGPGRTGPGARCVGRVRVRRNRRITPPSRPAAHPRKEPIMKQFAVTLLALFGVDAQASVAGPQRLLPILSGEPTRTERH